MSRILGFAVVAALVTSAAFGGERYLGTIVTWDGGYAANMSLMDAGFIIGQGSKLSVQPDGHAYVCVDSHINASGVLSCSSTSGVLVPAGALFTTSCSAVGKKFYIQESVSITLPDGGPSTLANDAGLFGPSCSVAVVALDGGTVNTKVFDRLGTEN